MRREPQAFALAYAIKKAALGPHVIPRWGWDEAQQRAIMEDKWRTKTFFRIRSGEETIGTIAIDPDGDGIEVGEFYILPQHQGKGLGGAVLEKVTREAGDRPVRLRVLKWNPAVELYRRSGFAVVGENDLHYMMERAPRR